MGRHFPVREISEKYYLLFLVIFKWTLLFPNMDIVFSLKKKKIKKNTGKVGEFCQSGKVGTMRKHIYVIQNMA